MAAHWPGNRLRCEARVASEICFGRPILFWAHGQPVDAPEGTLHPVIARLLGKFGDRKDVLQAVESNIHTFGWSGSRTTYYAPFKEPLGKLLQHPRPEVRRWAKIMLRQLDDVVANSHKEDEEREALAGM